MTLAQRFTLLVKGNLTGLFDALEDPERSLHQLVLDMEEQLEDAKRATAQALANEDRLRSRIEAERKDAADWEDSARRALAKAREDDAREAMRRAETGERQVARLTEQLRAQEHDTTEIRESVREMHDRLRTARERLAILQAKMRQSEARRAIGKVSMGVARANLYNEFDRLGERVEQRAAEEGAYLRLDRELRGEDVRRRFEADAVDDAVAERLAKLRRDLGGEEAEGEAA